MYLQIRDRLQLFRQKLPLSLTLVLSLVTPIGNALEIDSIETDNMRLIYQAPAQSYLAPYIARSFENSAAFQRRMFGYKIDEKVTVILTDFSDYGNASATALPRNTITAEVSPASLSFETFSSIERLQTFMNHEMVHIVNSDQASSRDKKFRRWFGGKVSPVAQHPESLFFTSLTTPRLTAPRWYFEGAAVFVETWMAGGHGRGQGAYDEMVFRAMVHDDAHFYRPLGLVSEGVKKDFKEGANYYLYGTRFMSYLAYTYTPEMVIAWLKRDDGSAADYEDQFQQVFGLPLERAWEDWITWEREFQNTNIASIQQYPTTPYEDLNSPPLGSVSRAFIGSDSNTMLAAVHYPGQVAHVALLDLAEGTTRRLADIKRPMLYRATSLAYDPEQHVAYYTTDNYGYRDIMRADLISGAVEMLLEDARIGELVINPADKSLWGVRHLNGLATLVRIPAPYGEWNQVHTWSFGEIVYDLDINPDGTLISMSHGGPDGNQRLQVFSLEKLLEGDSTVQSSFDFGVAVPEGFVFSPDGKYLFGSSYYTGVSNIFRYELSSGEVEAVSNAKVGLFRPIPMPDGTVIAFRYTQEGLKPTRITPVPLEDVSATEFLGNLVAKKHPDVRDWQLGSSNDIPLQDLITYEGKYRPFASMGLEQFYPIVMGYKDEVAGGMHVRFSDPVFFNSLDLDLAYSPASNLESDERWHAYSKYRYLGFTAEAKYNYADFYDLFGPTKESLKGHSLQLQYDKPLILDDPRHMDLELKAAYYGDLDRLPYAQEIDAVVDDIFTVSARLDYSNVRSSLGHVDDEKGYNWNLVAGASEVDGDYFPYVYGAFDFGFALPLNNSSIWLRTAAGSLSGDREDPFGNFFFGGFGNNWVDHLDIKRYRDPFRFPGYDIDDIPAQSFIRPMLEWNLPPYRFRNFGTPGFYVAWARPALFTSALLTDSGESEFSDEYYNLGAQMDFRLYVMSNFKMTLSVGYAHGYNDGDSVDEFMLSLKIMGPD